MSLLTSFPQPGISILCFATHVKLKHTQASLLASVLAAVTSSSYLSASVSVLALILFCHPHMSSPQVQSLLRASGILWPFLSLWILIQHLSHDRTVKQSTTLAEVGLHRAVHYRNTCSPETPALSPGSLILLILPHGNHYSSEQPYKR